MNMSIPYIDRIWRVKGTLHLDEPLSSQEAFERLDPLFQAHVVHYQVSGDTLSYRKKNPAAQDKLATFTAGTLHLEERDGTARLSYNLTSTALLLCFLAPLFFAGFGLLFEAINEWEAPALAAEKEAKEKEKEGEEEEPIELHWIDKMLGAPEPEQPGDEDEEEDAEKSAEEGEEGEEEEEEGGRHRPEFAYGLAGVFAAIYLVGRVLEPYLVKRTFRYFLRREDQPQDAGSQEELEPKTG